MGRTSFSYMLVLLLASLGTVASAEMYSWTDGDGMHFSDNPESIPKKYRKKAIAEARDKEMRAEPKESDPDDRLELYSPSPSSRDRHKVAKKAKQFRRGQRLAASETIGMEKRDGCYLSYSVQPGQGTHWTPNSSSSGVEPQMGRC